MKQSLASILALAAGSYASVIPSSREMSLLPRQACEHGPKSRKCWGEHSIDTNYYEKVPDTNHTVEYWLSAVEGPCSPDGYERTCMTFNGTIPGPTIIANWGDNVKVHVTNNMKSNGTAIHWHGLHMKENVLADGVPGVTQCPIAPGESMTYQFRATQYGSSWYHSHFSLQYSEGLFGGIIFNGPATENYDEDLGTLLLQDWGHKHAFELWHTAKGGRPPRLDGGLVNGTNTYDCTGSTDPKCLGTGKKFEAVFEKDKSYRLRLVNTAVDAVFQFSIDGHKLKVISNDFVPIVPYETDSVQLTVGQRYDVIVQANAAPGDYWLRGGYVGTCAPNAFPQDITGIIRYDASSTATPESTSTVTPSNSCLDEPGENLKPHLSLDVGNMPSVIFTELDTVTDSYFKWTINTSSLILDWKDPTMAHVFRNESVFPTPYNVYPVNKKTDAPEWAVLVIQDESGFNLAHPIHLHGHDFWVLAQASGVFNGSTESFNTKNPPRRDVATLPGNGYLAIAFALDNPGAWLVHCHIAWHASQGLSLEFVEDVDKIKVKEADKKVFEDTCKSWSLHTPAWPQDDSGI
ncbi:hypothetical protein OQA88_9917 [Cercophora sp. LCS_1]